MKNSFLLLLLILGIHSFVCAQEMNTSSTDIDEIEVTVQSVTQSKKGDTTTVVLVLQSYLKQNRELKLNTFATGLVNPEGKALLYTNMSMGKVAIQLNDKQNYLHYLLQRDYPVTLVVKTIGWQKRWGKPQQFRLTLEDHLEEGKFLQVDIPLWNS